MLQRGMLEPRSIHSLGWRFPLPRLQSKCDQDVTQLFAALDGLLHGVDAQGVCAVFDFCAQQQGR